MARALASHQCGPGSIPGLGVICGLSLLLVLVPAPRVFLRVLRFSSLHKDQHFQIPIRPGNSGEKSHPVDSTEILIYFIYLFYLNCAELCMPLILKEVLSKKKKKKNRAELPRRRQIGLKKNLSTKKFLPPPPPPVISNGSPLSSLR